MRYYFEANLLRRVAIKFNIMRVRLKISFMAFLKNQTVLEFWLNAIMKSLKFFDYKEKHCN